MSSKVTKDTCVVCNHLRRVMTIKVNSMEGNEVKVCFPCIDQLFAAWVNPIFVLGENDIQDVAGIMERKKLTSKQIQLIKSGIQHGMSYWVGVVKTAISHLPTNKQKPTKQRLPKKSEPTN